jgi:predicted NUDIX family NTP pyrophosphohydrolase
MPKRSAGLILFRRRAGQLQVLLVHPGGPYFAKKDAGAWSIPKGEYTDGEDPKAVALREFEEETGLQPTGHLLSLGEVRQAGGKVVTAFALNSPLTKSLLRDQPTT